MMLRGVCAVFALALLVSACGYKGLLKSPSQIEAEEQKRSSQGGKP